MSEKTKKLIGWLIVAVAIVVAAFLGVVYPIPEPPDVQAMGEGDTNLTNLILDRPSGDGSDNYLKLDAAQLMFDADADTYMEADTDDQIDVTIADGDDFQFTADTFTAQTGSSIKIGGASDIELSTTSFDLNDTYIDQDIETENLMLPSVVSSNFTYTLAAGTTVTLATVSDGEIWLIHCVYADLITDFTCTGDDEYIDVGNSGDADGLLDLDHAELQAADTEGTGAPAGWQGFMSADTVGAYLSTTGSCPIVADGDDVAIQAVLGEGTGETITAGEITIYIVYTRIQ